MPAARLATYSNIAIDYWPQKDDPYQIQITAGGNLKLPWRIDNTHSGYYDIKTPLEQHPQHTTARYMCLNLKNFYLSAPPQPVQIHAYLHQYVLAWIVVQYDLLHKVVKGHIYLEMQQALWGLPQAGILANKLLCKQLVPHGY
jgi:hypothetical protein